MTVTLGGLTLSDNLVLDGLENSPAIAMSARRTLGGRMISTFGPSLTGGRSLSLQSENHLTLAQIISLKTFEASGAALTLSHPRGTFTVSITGIEVEPDSMVVNPDGSIWYSGVINLIEV